MAFCYRRPQFGVLRSGCQTVGRNTPLVKMGLPIFCGRSFDFGARTFSSRPSERWSTLTRTRRSGQKSESTFEPGHSPGSNRKWVGAHFPRRAGDDRRVIEEPVSPADAARAGLLKRDGPALVADLETFGLDDDLLRPFLPRGKVFKLFSLCHGISPSQLRK
jgi:hypothetical protein